MCNFEYYDTRVSVILQPYVVDYFIVIISFILCVKNLAIRKWY